MKTYTIMVPYSGVVMIDVKAGSEEEAHEKAKEKAGKLSTEELMEEAQIEQDRTSYLTAIDGKDV